MAELGFEVGMVCGRCDAFSAFGTEVCRCGRTLSIDFSENSARPGANSTKPDKDRSQAPEIVGRSSVATSAAPTGSVPAQRLQESLMDQARYFVCESCMTPVPSGHKFCGRCGAPVPDAMLHQPVDFYSDMQD